MAFLAKNFVYNDIASENFDLQIANVDGGNSSNMGSGVVEFLESYVWKRQKPYFYGISYSDKLTFPVTIFSQNEITALDSSYIHNWLFAQLQYKNLSIIQDDMDDVYFKTIFTNPQVLRFGNVIYGFQADAVCDSQFAYTYEKTTTYNYTTATTNTNITFYNNSHYPGYLYPEISFTINTSGSGNLAIINATDDPDRSFSFFTLESGEIITVNNDLGIVSSNLNTPRLSRFSKNWLRFVPGVNTLSVVGNISQLNITYQFLRRVGG